jgi:hypothetical protein
MDGLSIRELLKFVEKSHFRQRTWEGVGIVIMTKNWEGVGIVIITNF